MIRRSWFLIIICIAAAFLNRVSLAETKEAKDTLDAYFNKLIEFFAASDSKGEKPDAMAGLNIGGSFWKQDSKQSRLEAVDSALFFFVNRPKSFEYIETKQAGDFARFHVKTQTKEVTYSLIREGEDWKIVSFKDLNKIKKDREPKKEVEKTLYTFSSPDELLEAYFTKSKGLSPAGKDPIESFKETEAFWIDSKKNKRYISNSHSFFNAFNPSSWSIDFTDRTEESAAATVTFVVGNPAWTKLKGKQVTKEAEYKMVKHNGYWLLSEFSVK